MIVMQMAVVQYDAGLEEAVKRECKMATPLAFASCDAIFGSVIVPSKPFAYCCTNCRYAVTGLSITVWNAEPPRYLRVKKNNVEE